MYLNKAIFREIVVITRCIPDRRIIIYQIILFRWKPYTIIRKRTLQCINPVGCPRDGCSDAYLAAILIQFFIYKIFIIFIIT